MNKGYRAFLIVLASSFASLPAWAGEPTEPQNMAAEVKATLADNDKKLEDYLMQIMAVQQACPHCSMAPTHVAVEREAKAKVEKLKARIMVLREQDRLLKGYLSRNEASGSQLMSREVALENGIELKTLSTEMQAMSRERTLISSLFQRKAQGQADAIMTNWNRLFSLVTTLSTYVDTSKSPSNKSSTATEAKPAAPAAAPDASAPSGSTKSGGAL